jgi:hypothetical protein
MQLTLTASDLAAMPTALRQELIDYLATRRKGVAKAPARAQGRGSRETSAGPYEGLAVLDRSQAIALLRAVSFGAEERGVHDLIEALAYGEEAQAPGSAHLAQTLELEDSRHLQRLLAAIRRRLRSVTRDVLPLVRYSRPSRTYIVHPRTRASLREVFAEMVRPEAGSEPPWA